RGPSACGRARTELSIDASRAACLERPDYAEPLIARSSLLRLSCNKSDELARDRERPHGVLERIAPQSVRRRAGAQGRCHRGRSGPGGGGECGAAPAGPGERVLSMIRGPVGAAVRGPERGQAFLAAVRRAATSFQLTRS